MNFPFDVYICYAYVGFVCAVIIGVILNRNLATTFKNTIDKKLTAVFIFFITFCVIDATWGIIGYVAGNINSGFTNLYRVMTYMFHLMAALSSAFIAWYAVSFFKMEKKSHLAFKIVRIAIFTIQLALIVQNFWTSSFFTISNEGVYNGTAQIRRIAFYLQFMQYLPLVAYAITMSIILKRRGKNKEGRLHLNGLFFLLIPVVFGVLQMLYPDGPFYSLGFAGFSVAIYAITVTKQRENYLADYHRLDEQKRNQEALEKALETAKEANTVKSKFLANMSHDIRTPINGIMGVVELSKRTDDPEELKKYLSKIDIASHHLLSLVNDVLDMSLIENKAEQLFKEETIDIRTVVDECASIINGQLINREIYLKVNYKNEIKNPIIYGDSLRLKQIFINILGNSVKFTKTGGITFDVEEINSSSIDITKVVFTITDTGIGMSKEFLTHIFEPFAQEANSSRTKFVGTGLGMSIMKQLVDLMGGSVAIESELGKGTKFIVTIPFKVSKEELNTVKNVQNQEEFDMSGLKVMLVEDNELNSEIAKTILEDGGVKVTCCFDGQEAYDTFVNNEPGTFDVILMDIMMPKLNGYQATEKIRAFDRKDAKEIPIIAMTANAFDEDKKQAILAGMNGHIAKPIDFKTLFVEIKKNLRK